MYPPATILTSRSTTQPPSWSALVVSYALIPIVFLSLWILEQPLAGSFVIATLAGIGLGTRRILTVIRCVRDCGACSLAVAGDIHITIARIDG
ncbi:MAG: hypothetical protein ABEH65_00590 [Halobacteriales archaeon]